MRKWLASEAKLHADAPRQLNACVTRNHLISSSSIFVAANPSLQSGLASTARWLDDDDDDDGGRLGQRGICPR